MVAPLQPLQDPGDELAKKAIVAKSENYMSGWCVLFRSKHGRFPNEFELDAYTRGNESGIRVALEVGSEYGGVQP